MYRTTFLTAMGLVLLVAGRSTAQIQYQFTNLSGTPQSSFSVLVGQTLQFQIYLLEGPPATNINSQGGMGSAGARVTIPSATNATMTPVPVAGANWPNGGTTGGSSSTVANLNTLSGFSMGVFAGSDGRLLIGTYSVTGVSPTGVGGITMTAADDPSIAGNNSHFDSPFNSLDPLISSATANLVVNPIPEPSSMLLGGLGAAGLAIIRRRRRKATVCN